MILTILKDAADQLPKSARADEAQLLADIQRKAAWGFEPRLDQVGDHDSHRRQR